MPAVPYRPHVALREVRRDDAAALGQVMWSAFQNSGDDEFERTADAETEVVQTFDGKWGPFVAEASVVAVIDPAIASAVLVVLDNAHDLTPLLAFAFAVTVPELQGRGLGGWLIENSIRRLDAAGNTELHLAVLPTSPARRLYERLGFTVAAGS